MFIVLNSMEKVKRFVDIISKFESDVDIESGKYSVDAKSIMGIFSLNLSRPLKVIIHDQSQTEKIENSIAVFAS